MDGVKQALCELIAREQNFEQLQLETEINITSDSSRIPISELCLLNAIEEQAKASNIDVSVLAPSIIAKRLLKHIGKEMKLLPPQQLNACQMLISTAKAMFRDGEFNTRTFTKLLVKQNTALPLELIWMLHNSGIVTLDAYITSNLSKAHVIGKIAEDVAALCQGEEETLERRRCIVNDLTACLLSLSYQQEDTDATSKGLKKIAVALTDSVTKHLLKADKGDINALKCLHEPTLDLSSEAIKKFCARQLALVLSRDPQFKVAEVLSSQSDWTYAKLSSFVRDIYTQLLLPFTAEECIGVMRRVLEQQEVNWQAVLSFTATVLVSFSDAADHLSTMVNELLQSACEQNNMESLITAFLLVRQACLEGQHVFSSYQQWFANTFADSPTNPASNKKCFAFLVKFLTEVVPYDSAACMKAHVLKPPFIPAKCRPIWSDYVSLAKTRLTDLKEPLDEVGIYDGSGEHGEKDKEAAAQDVDRALAMFEKTAKVPASVMEASIFRKPYFIGRFLPALLLPRLLPDAHDARMRLIEALHNCDKIPGNLYNAYKKGCEKIAQQLLDGVFSENEDEMEDFLLSPWQQFTNALEAFQKHATEGQADGLSCHVSILSEKIHGVLETTGDSISPPPLIDIHTASNSSSSMHTAKVSHELLNAVCHTHHQLLQPGPGGGSDEAAVSYGWLKALLSILPGHCNLAKTFYQRILHLCTNQESPLDAIHIRTLALIVATTFLSPNLMQTVRVDSEPFVSHLAVMLPYRTREAMISTLQFLAFFLQHCLLLHTTYMDMPQDMMKQFEFLRLRLCTSMCSVSLGSQHSTLIQLLDTITTSELYQQMREKTQLSVEEWIKMEMSIVPHHDIFTDEQRLSVQEHIMFSRFFPMFEKPCKENGRNPIAEVCTAIATQLVLPTNIRPPHQNVCENHMMKHCCQNTDSSSHMMLLLIRLVQYLPSMKQCEESPLWLSSLYTHLEGVTGKCNEWKQKFCSLMLQLPPYLLFENACHHHQLATPCLSQAVEMINQQWVQYLSEGAVLSLAACVHILKSCASFPPHDLLSQLLTDSTPFRESVMFHWSNIKHYSKSLGLAEVEALCAIDQLSAFSTQLLAEPDTDIPSMIGEQELKLIAASLYAHFCSSPLEHRSACLAVLKRQERDSALTSAFLQHLLCDVAQNIILHSKEEKNTDTLSLPHMLCSVLEVSPHILHTSHTWSSSSSSLTTARQHIVDLIPVAVFKCLSVCKEEALRDVAVCSGCVTAVLRLYQGCIELYEKTMGQTKDQVENQGEVGPLSLEYLLDMGQFVQTVLHIAPSRCINKIKQDFVESLDPALQIYISTCRKT